MLTVRMTQTAKGAPDGIQVNVYQEGEVYTLPPSLVTNFLAMEVCEVLSGDKLEAESEGSVETKVVQSLGDETKESKSEEESEEVDVVVQTKKGSKTVRLPRGGRKG
jgi:hypothetical protein